jgi:predicted metal-dependent phosphoesterase TrpH
MGPQLNNSRTLLRLDLHVHTQYSPDCLIDPRRIIDICRSRNINGVAVTDHNTIEGALLMTRYAPGDFTVIVGEEVMTSSGEIIGLFLTEHIPPGLTPEETVSRIKRQSGLVCIPHPFGLFRKRLKCSSLSGIINSVDIIEVVNGRNIFRTAEKRASDFATANNKAMCAGSDAHVPLEYGRVCTTLGQFSSSADFLRSLHDATFDVRKIPPVVRFASSMARFLRRRTR